MFHMIANPEKYFLWSFDPDWYDFDENDEPYLTENAPGEAKESFKAYHELSNRKENTKATIV